MGVSPVKLSIKKKNPADDSTLPGDDSTWKKSVKPLNLYKSLPALTELLLQRLQYKSKVAIVNRHGRQLYASASITDYKVVKVKGGVVTEEMRIARKQAFTDKLENRLYLMADRRMAGFQVLITTYAMEKKKRVKKDHGAARGLAAKKAKM
jgi:hypothetical protein